MNRRSSFLPRFSLHILAGAALVVGASGSAHAAATLVKAVSQTGTTSVAPKWTSAVASGHLVVAIIQYRGNVPSITAPTVTSSSTAVSWHLAANISQGTNVGVAIYYDWGGETRANNDTETFGIAGSTSSVVELADFSGVDLTADPLGVVGTSVATSAGSITVTTSSATSVSSSVAVGAFGSDGSSNGNSETFGNAAAPFSNILADLAGPTDSHTLSTYQAGVASGSTVTETATPKKNEDMAAAMATFKVVVVTHYWRSSLSGCTGTWSDASCWTTSPAMGAAATGGVPASSDDVIFDSLSGSCTVNGASTVPANSITVQTGFGGTITQTQAVSLAGALDMRAGTYSEGNFGLAV